MIMNRGVVKAKMRQFKGALEDYKMCQQYNPDNIELLNNLANTLNELGRTDEGIAYLKKVIEINPDFVGSYINLGFQLVELGKYGDAIDYLDIAIEKSSENEIQRAISLNNRGYAYYKLFNYEKALKDIDDSIHLFGNNSYAYRNRALVYLRLKRNRDACDDLYSAISLGFTQEYGSEVERLLAKHCK